VATCCHRTRCWRCLNEGHRSFSCPRRRPHHHNRIEEDHDLHRRGPMDDFYNSMGHHRGRGNLHGSPPRCSSPSSPLLCVLGCIRKPYLLWLMETTIATTGGR
jgi:hypothetical protein